MSHRSVWTHAEVEPLLTPWRRARVVKVVDGDTLDLQVDLGFDVHTVTRIRLVGAGVLYTDQGELAQGVDAWEVRGEEREKGLAAKRRVVELLESGEVRVFSAKGGSRGKYGRWIACVLYPQGGLWYSLGDTLVAEGHAEAWP